jgi:hypothetical protein
VNHERHYRTTVTFCENGGYSRQTTLNSGRVPTLFLFLGGEAMSSTMVVIQCPTCSQKYRVEAGAIGNEVPCQTCGINFLAVDIDAAPLPASPRPAPPVEANSAAKVGRQTVLRLEAQRLAQEKPNGVTRNQGLILISVVLVGLGLQLVQVLAVRRPVWEYKILAPADAGLEAALNAEGKDGWEVVSARRATEGKAGSFLYEMIMKRPKR